MVSQQLAPCAMEIVRGVSATISPWPKRVVRSGDIIAVVCAYYDITEDQLRSPVRTYIIRQARQQVMHLLCKHCSLPDMYVGRLFNRDRTTVVHSRHVVSDLCETDTAYRRELLYIEHLIEQTRY
jgi:chromosomal replication initiation ATPase DnaA